jgi:hypothetical protein
VVDLGVFTAHVWHIEFGVPKAAVKFFRKLYQSFSDSRGWSLVTASSFLRYRTLCIKIKGEDTRTSAM